MGVTGVAGFIRAEIPGHVNFIMLVLMNETFSFAEASSIAAAFSSGSVIFANSLPVSGMFRTSTKERPYWCAKSIASACVLPISSVIALMLAFEMRDLNALNGPAAARIAAPAIIRRRVKELDFA